jgi:hypothetical protein
MEFFVKYENEKKSILVCMDDKFPENAREITETEAKRIKISTTYDRLSHNEKIYVIAEWVKKYELNVKPTKQPTLADFTITNPFAEVQ